MRVIWTYPFPLDDGSFAQLHLPPDLTQREANRIKKLLDAVVLEPAAAPHDKDDPDGPT